MRFPSDWALAQNNLGITYADRIRGDRAENLERAIACYQAALKCAPARHCRSMGRHTMNLGAVYADRIRDDRAENLERAISCYTAALTVYTRNAAPQRWAQVQNNLGSAYSARMLGEQGENIDRAILCYQAALEVHTRDGSPLDWARLQNNLGDAYLAASVANAPRIRSGRWPLPGGARGSTPAMVPAGLGACARNEGRVYVQRATGDRLAPNSDQALACYQDTLTVYTRTRSHASGLPPSRCSAMSTRTRYARHRH